MSKRKRTIITLIVVELLLAAMGIVLALSPLLYLMARKNDLKEK